MEQQKNSNWCWAAVTSSVFRALSNASISQEQVVCQVLTDPNCSQQPTPQECNQVFLLDIALPQVCQCSLSTQGLLAFTDLQNEIDNRSHPVPIGIEFATPEGTVLHYCLIKGCNGAAGLQEVILLDPAHMDAGESHISYADLCDGVVLGATWTQSFVIQ